MSLGLKRNSTKNQDGTITCVVSAKIDQYFEKRTFSRFNYQTYIITNEVDTSKLYSLLQK